MALHFENNSFASELFKERQLRHSSATQQQLELAKQSLIYKKKCHSNVHSILFCKSLINVTSQIATQNQKKILEEQRSKYFQYIRKAYRQKIPEDFQNENKLKKAIKNKIRQKNDKESNLKRQEVKKRERPSGPSLALRNEENKKARKVNSKQKQKKAVKQDQKKIIEENQNGNQFIQRQEQNFQSQIDLHNDQIDDSFGDDQDQI